MTTRNRRMMHHSIIVKVNRCRCKTSPGDIFLLNLLFCSSVRVQGERLRLFFFLLVLVALLVFVADLALVLPPVVLH